jgi:aerobic C4-dicarboxylate transport protein
LGIDRFMSEARALTNLIGNGVATVVAAKWENELDMQKLNDAFGNMEAATVVVSPDIFE